MAEPGGSSNPRDSDDSQNEADSADDLAKGSDARSAQLTLISILLGVILAALLAGLPHGATTFALTAVTLDLGEAARVVTVLLLGILLWLEYTWNTLARLATATPAHNLTYFALAMVASGAALAVSDFRAWFAWLCALAFSGIVAAIVNRTTFPKSWDQSIVRRLIFLDYVELALYVLVGLAAGAITWLSYADDTPWSIPATTQVWLCVSVAVLAALNLIMQARLYIPMVRRAWTTRSTGPMR